MTLTRDTVLAWLAAYAEAVNQHAAEFNRLDSALGDGDFGASMQRGVQAIAAKVPAVADKDIGTIFKTIGMTLVSTMGGTSGPLMGTLFIQMAGVAQGKDALTLADVTDMFKAGVDGIMARGKAQVGDKTMLDAFGPAVDALIAAKDRPETLGQALGCAAEAAQAGRDHTATLVAKKGRGSYVGERGVGHIDPGAANAYLFIHTLAETVTR